MGTSRALLETCDIQIAHTQGKRMCSVSDSPSSAQSSFHSHLSHVKCCYTSLHRFFPFGGLSS